MYIFFQNAVWSYVTSLILTSFIPLITSFVLIPLYTFYPFVLVYTQELLVYINFFNHEKHFIIKILINSKNGFSFKLNVYCPKKNALYLNVNVFSTKVLIGTVYFTTPNGDGTAILRGHPSHAKVQPPAGRRSYLHLAVIFLRPWVLVRPREWNPRPPAPQSNTLPTKLILPLVYPHRLTIIINIHCNAISQSKLMWKKWNE